MSSPHNVFTEATEHLDDRQAHDVLPAQHRINPDVVAQPVDDSGGYVFGQVGWLDGHGTTYGLRLPDNIDRDGTSLRPLYICLGRHLSPPDEVEPCA